MKKNLKVYIEVRDYHREVEIYVTEERLDGELYVAKPVQLIFEKDDDLQHLEPTIRLTGLIGEAFLKAMAEALDERGVKTDKDAKLEGTIEALRLHLRDMRVLAGVCGQLVSEKKEGK